MGQLLFQQTGLAHRGESRRRDYSSHGFAKARPPKGAFFAGTAATHYSCTALPRFSCRVSRRPQLHTAAANSTFHSSSRSQPAYVRLRQLHAFPQQHHKRHIQTCHTSCRYAVQSQRPDVYASLAMEALMEFCTSSLRGLDLINYKVCSCYGPHLESFANCGMAERRIIIKRSLWLTGLHDWHGILRQVIPVCIAASMQVGCDNNDFNMRPGA